jgi:regulator of sirC expression with transglutaminase-like and TPR domain
MAVDPTARHTERFVALFARAETDASYRAPLDEVALSIAGHARPDLDIAEQRHHLDALAEAVGEGGLPMLRDVLFGAESTGGRGFHGNRDDYYDPDNSMLDQVLVRRIGIPITLSVLTIEVGRRVGLDLVGVGLPGHFLVGDGADRPSFLDPFNGGRLLDVAGCGDLFRSVQGGAAPFDPRWLAPVGVGDIAARMLTNLRAVYAQRQDQISLEWVTRLRARVPGAGADAWREHALVASATGRFTDAAHSYERAAMLGDGGRAAEDAAMAQRLRARLN